MTEWDLWGTERAIFITCVSGLGEIQNSEGVFGLRRTLSIAGAKYVIRQNPIGREIIAELQDEEIRALSLKTANH